ncbi:MAG: ion transporter [Aquificae bacterium]|nr:ion transporter [Aquificota bacterium]
MISLRNKKDPFLYIERDQNIFRRKYIAFKLKIYNILENETSPYKQVYDIFALFIVITSSIGIFIDYIELGKKLPPDLAHFLHKYEIWALYFFLIEYILRWWVVSNFFDDFKKGLYEYAEESNSIKRVFLAFLYALQPKIRWMIKPYSIIDLLAILPLFRPFRAFRILRALRLLKIIRYGGAIKSIFLALKEQGFLFIFIILLLVTWVVTFSLVVYVVEYNAGNENFSSIFYAIYWGIVTISTVGYGDITPISETGRFITSIMISGGIFFVAALTGTFSAALVGRLMTIKEGAITMRNLEDHIVICGWNETAEEIMEELMSLEIEKEKGVVVITNVDKKDMDIELNEYILYKKGNFVHENVLMDVGIDKASDVIIVGEREEGKDERDVDARTALTAMLVKTLNPKANIYVEVLLDEDADIFKKRIKVKEIIVRGQIVGKMIFSSLLNPGAIDLVQAIIDKERGIRKVKVRKLGKFETFGQLLKAVREKDYMPIAIERHKKIILSPPDSFLLKEDDFVFLIPTSTERLK